jgi:hypothetical protein
LRIFKFSHPFVMLSGHRSLSSLSEESFLSFVEGRRGDAGPPSTAPQGVAPSGGLFATRQPPVLLGAFRVARALIIIGERLVGRAMPRIFE